MKLPWRNISAVISNSKVTPGQLAMIAMAFEKYHETKEFLIPDNLIESKLASILLKQEKIQEIAVYGMKDHIRTVAELKVFGQELEVMAMFTPTDVKWGKEYLLEFDSKIVSWKGNTTIRLGVSAIKKTILEILPLGGILNSIINISIDYVLNSIGIAKLAKRANLSEKGIKWNGNHVTFDLTALPDLKLLWDFPHNIPGIDLAKKLIGKSPQIADLIEIENMRATRDGLLFKIKLSTPVQKIFKTFATAYNSFFNSDQLNLHSSNNNK